MFLTPKFNPIFPVARVRNAHDLLCWHDCIAALKRAFVLAVMWSICALYCGGAFGQITNQVASGDSVWAAVKNFFYGKWALVIGCLVLVGCVFAFFSKGALFASVGVAAVVIIYLLPAIAQGLQSLAQSLVGN